MNNKVLSIGLALALGAGYSLSAYSQAKPEVVVKQRQSAMVLQGKYFGPMGAMAQGKVPYDAKIVARNVTYLDVLSKLPWDGFTPATKDEKTGALPAVYSDTAKFKEAIDRFEGEVAKLVSVSKGGDEAATKAQISAVAKACGGCHESFREKR